MDRLHSLCVYKSYCHVDIQYYEIEGFSPTMWLWAVLIQRAVFFYIYIYLCVMQGAAASPERTTPRGGQPSGVEVPTKLMMEPSDDDDEDTGKTHGKHWWNYISYVITTKVIAI